jgi:hypothetical protein
MWICWVDNFCRYGEWQKKNKTLIPMAGEQELGNATSFANGYTTDGRRYRHNSTTAPTPNSKNAIRKSFKRFVLSFNIHRAKDSADVAGGSGAGNGMVEIKRGQRTRMVKQKSVGDGPRTKNELKSRAEIVKGRKDLAKKREKNGRHAN